MVYLTALSVASKEVVDVVVVVVLLKVVVVVLVEVVVVLDVASSVVVSTAAGVVVSENVVGITVGAKLVLVSTLVDSTSSFSSSCSNVDLSLIHI